MNIPYTLYLWCGERPQAAAGHEWGWSGAARAKSMRSDLRSANRQPLLAFGKDYVHSNVLMPHKLLRRLLCAMAISISVYEGARLVLQEARSDLDGKLTLEQLLSSVHAGDVAGAEVGAADRRASRARRLRSGVAMRDARGARAASAPQTCLCMQRMIRQEQLASLARAATKLRNHTRSVGRAACDRVHRCAAANACGYPKPQTPHRFYTRKTHTRTHTRTHTGERA